MYIIVCFLMGQLGVETRDFILHPVMVNLSIMTIHMVDVYDQLQLTQVSMNILYYELAKIYQQKVAKKNGFNA